MVDHRTPQVDPNNLVTFCKQHNHFFSCAQNLYAFIVDDDILRTNSDIQG